MQSAEKVSLGMALSHAITLLYTHGCLTEAQRDAARRKASARKDELVSAFPEPRLADEFELKLCSGVSGQSVYLNDYRIAGAKPLGGGTIVKKWSVRPKDIVSAVSQ